MSNGFREMEVIVKGTKVHQTQEARSIWLTEVNYSPLQIVSKNGNTYSWDVFEAAK